MTNHLEVLKSAELFKGIAEADLRPLLSCLSAKTVRCEKNRIVFMSGEDIKSFGIVIEGQVQVYQEDYYGNKSILANLGPGHLFGESFACAEIQTLPVSVLATTESELLFIDCRRLSEPCTHACAFHSRLIRNLLNIIALKNISLTQKIEFTSKRSTREKLLAYLDIQSKKQGRRAFAVPFNRQELADYLCVDRSAMSNELSKLRDEGVLRFHKNQFEML